MTHTPFLSLVIIACMASPLAAQDSAPPKDPPAKPAPKPVAKIIHPEIAMKTEVKVDGKTDATNYVHYFVWLRLYEYNLVVHSETPSTAEKWILAKVEKNKKAKGSLNAADAKKAEGLNPPKLRVETSIEVKYKPSKFQGRIVAHIYRGTVTGTIKDSTGKVLKEIKLRHAWGSNTGFKRRKILTQYLGHLAKWVLLDLFQLPEFQGLLTEKELEVLEKEIAAYEADKNKLYDDTP